MPHPLTALLIATVLLVVAWLAFRPEGGWFWRWRRSRELTDRVLHEDALKHLHEREYEGRLATRESLAGVLGLTPGLASEMIRELSDRGLAAHSGDGYILTPEGRRYALQVIRAHRLWERYLADETELEPGQIHAQAERAEHRLTSEQTDELEARLGYPTHDPHGDPIPSSDGEIADRDGMPLTKWPVDQTGRIVHLEDEPPEVYAQLLAQGLRLGLDVRVLDRSAGEVRFFTEQQEFVVASVVAENITVAPLPSREKIEGSWQRLSEIEQGRAVRVVGLDENCRGLTRRRFMDLGLTPGSMVEVDRPGPFGDPRAYRVRGTSIALRKEQAGLVLVEPVPDESKAADEGDGDS